MKAGMWYEGVTGRGETLFWLLVMAGIFAYSWWTHANGDLTLIFVTFVAFFVEFDLSTRHLLEAQVARLSHSSL